MRYLTAPLRSRLSRCFALGISLLSRARKQAVRPSLSSASKEVLAKFGREQSRQATAPAPPTQALDLQWWRRRFRLRSLNFASASKVCHTRPE